MNPEIFDWKRKSIYPRKCEKCSKTLKNKVSFCKHRKSCGKKKLVTYPRTCEQCNKCYSTVSSFSKHKKKYHSSATLNSDDPEPVLKTFYTCNLCGVCYSNKHHLLSCTGKGTRINFECIVTDCNKSFTCLQLLHKHLLSEHGVSSIKDITFESLSAFQQWLETEGKATFTSFVKLRGDRKIGNKIYYYYSCQFRKRKDFQRLTSRRNIKGTIPDYNCPVRVYGTEENGTVRALYFHYHNHKLSFENAKFWRLRKSVRDTIKNKYLKFKTKSDFKLENKCDTYIYTPETKELKAESCKNLAFQLIKFLKDPKIPDNTLKNIYTTLNGLVSECRAATEKDINVKEISKSFPPNKKIPCIKQFNVSKKRKLKSMAPNNLLSKCIKLSSPDKLNTFDPSITNNEPFTPPLLNDNVLEPVVSVDNYSLNILELKSIDPSISDEEVENLKLYSAHFRKGWLYDSVINSFISKILNNSQNILFIDSVVSQAISTNISSQLYFPHPPNLAKYLVIPLCINSHWILVVADIPGKIFNVYDPLNEHFNNSYLKNILNIGGVLNKYLEGNFLWKVMSPPHDLQKDIMSCGVYICYYVYQLYNLQNMNQLLNTFEFRKFIYNTLMGDKCITKLS